MTQDVGPVCGNRISMNLKVVLFGAKTQQEAIRMIEAGAKKKGIVIDDRRRDDFTIKNG